MSEESSAHDNDADTRPRVYTRCTAKDGEVEVEVQGGEGEEVGDIRVAAAEQLELANDKHDELSGRDDPHESGGGFQ